MKIMNIKEVCEYLNIKRSSFYNYKNIGLPVHTMPSGKPYCFKEEIDQWIQNKEVRKDERDS